LLRNGPVTEIKPDHAFLPGPAPEIADIGENARRLVRV
jgi:hypothetical protein